MADIKKSLPPSVTAIYQVGAVLDTLSLELTRVKETIDQAYKNLYMPTIKGGYQHWEQLFGIEGNSTLTPEARKRAIIIKKSVFETPSALRLQGLLTQLTGGEARVVMNHEARVLEVEANVPLHTTDYSYLHAVLAARLPAHLKYTLNVTAHPVVTGISVPRDLGHFTISREIYVN